MAAAPLCTHCVAAALEKNNQPRCDYFGTEKGCRFGDNCYNRHQKVCPNIGKCKDEDCDLSHSLPPCTHRAAPAPAQAARAPVRARGNPPPAPVLVSGPRAPAAAAPAPPAGVASSGNTVAVKRHEFSVEAPAYVTIDELAQAQENAFLRQTNDELLQENETLVQDNYNMTITLEAMMRMLKQYSKKSDAELSTEINAFQSEIEIELRHEAEEDAAQEQPEEES